MNKPKLILNSDYTINSNGDLVFTEKYLLARGYCCQSGCLNCPYSKEIDPNTPPEFNSSWSKTSPDGLDEDEEN